jgi:hypothetical protein
VAGSLSADPLGSDSTMPSTPPPRLALLWARAAPRAIILRRGPSKTVELVLWDTEHDEFEPGHWFRGRIYERRCDLSPNGRLFVYFASKFNSQTVRDDSQYTYAWTAVSRPPYLTALALWPKGDCWWGGGLFRNNRTLFLNHRPAEATPHPDHRPKRLVVEPNPEARGEDDPLYGSRLTRDGWHLRQEGQIEFRGLDAAYVTLVPEVRERRQPQGPLRIVMTRRLDVLRYSERFEVLGAHGPVPIGIQRASWLDWDHRGRLVALARGGVWAAAVHGGEVGEFGRLLDLTPHKFEARPTPPWAEHW